MSSKDTLNRLSQAIIKEYLTFDPTSDSTKPPHVANGLFRNCLGENFSIKEIHEWVLSERRLKPKNENKIISSSDIIKKYHDILQKGEKENPENIKQFRLLLEEVFNQDNTVYPSLENSVMTISSHWLIRSYVKSEAKIGDFIYGILSKEINGKKSPIIDLIKETLKKENDDITKIIKPILTFQSGDKVNCHKNDTQFFTEKDIKWDSYKVKIREGFDRLAINIKAKEETNNSLLVLQRIICFVGFVTFAYLSHANSAIYNGVDVPIIIDSGNDLESIKKASELSYILAKKSVEDYFINTLSVILKSEINNFQSVQACKAWISEMVIEEVEKENEIKNAVLSYFNSFVDETSPINALSKALQIVLYTFKYASSSPSDYCRVLGIRCGLIGPKGNRANVKRYLINSFTLETITLSILSENELKQGIDLKELGKKAFRAYNIFFGANADEEYSILEKYNISQSTPGDLRGDLSLNAQYLIETYISLDFAKKYADGVTLIGWRL